MIFCDGSKTRDEMITCLRERSGITVTELFTDWEVEILYNFSTSDLLSLLNEGRGSDNLLKQIICELQIAKETRQAVHNKEIDSNKSTAESFR